MQKFAKLAPCNLGTANLLNTYMTSSPVVNLKIPSFSPLVLVAERFSENNTRTSKVGAIFEAQKAQNIFIGKKI